MRFLAPEDGGKGGSGGKSAADAQHDKDRREAMEAAARKRGKPDASDDDGSGGSSILEHLMSDGEGGEVVEDIPSDSFDLDLGGADDKGGGTGDGAGAGGDGASGKAAADYKDIFKSIDDAEPVGSQAIKQKFKLKKEDLERARIAIKERDDKLAKLEADLAEARKGAGQQVNVEDSDAFKKLKGELDAANELVSRVSLVDSAAFKDKYEAPIAALHKKAASYLLRIPDQAKRIEFANKVDAMLKGIAPGEDNDPEFYERMSEMLESDDIKEGMRRGLDPILSDLRTKINERFAAEADWKKTRKELGDIQLAGVSENGKKIRDAFGLVRAKFAADNKDIIEKLVGEKDPYGYVESSKAFTAGVQDDLESLVKTGVPQARLLALLSDGIEHQTLVKRHEALMKLTKSIAAQLTEAKKKLKAEGDDEATEVRRKKTGNSSGSGSGEEDEYSILGEIRKATAGD